MTQTKPRPPNVLLRQAECDERLRLEKTAEMLGSRDPLANNPKMLLEHVFTLVRPDELVAAHLIWLGICKQHNVTSKNAARLRYMSRVMTDYAIIEAHTHLHEPIYDIDKH